MGAIAIFDNPTGRFAHPKSYQLWCKGSDKSDSQGPINGGNPLERKNDDNFWIDVPTKSVQRGFKGVNFSQDF